MNATTSKGWDMSGTNAELIKMARAWLDGEMHPLDADVITQLADALETAEAERDAALATIGEVAADLDAELAGLMTHAMDGLQTRIRAIIEDAK